MDEQTRLSGLHKRYQEAVSRVKSWVRLLDLEEHEINPDNVEQTLSYIDLMLERYTPMSGDEEYTMMHGINFIHCPSCKAKHIKAKYKYCPYCGQALARKVHLTDEDFFY